MKDRAPLKFPLYSAIGMSRCGKGTLNLVPATTYSVFSVTKAELWFPAEFGTSMISVVSKVVRSIRAILGVLFPLMNTQRPSSSPAVCETSGWWESSQGMKPCEVFSMGLVSSLKPQAFSASTENTGITLKSLPEGSP